ncbi:MAG: DMT family transporter, partial [Actinobacteria bacterium]
PLFTTVIAVSMGRERSGWATWAGLALSTVGLVLMADAKGGFGAIGASAALIVLAALCFALYTLVTKPLLTRYRPLEVTSYAVIAGSLPFLVFAPGAVAELRTASAADVATLVFLATMPGGIAYVLWSRAVKGLTPGVAARFLYLVPVLGIPVAWVWVGEAPGLLTVVGGLVTLGGVALASMMPSTRSAAAPIVIEHPLTSAEAA